MRTQRQDATYLSLKGGEFKGMSKNSLTVSTPCFDAGSEYCPCALADLRQCVSCSLLRGLDVCQCGWNGLCVYAEYVRRKEKSKEPRQIVAAKVLDRKELTNTPIVAFIFRLSVPESISRWCIFPGSFLLLRPSDTPERYNVPLTVMEAQEGSVTLALEVKGPKTYALEKNIKPGKEITVTGPFSSGIQGVGYLKSISTRRVLAIAKGMGQPAVLGAARQVLSRGGYFKVMIGPGNMNLVFIQDSLLKMGAQFEIMEREKDHNLARLEDEILGNHYDVVFSSGSPSQHKGVLEIVKRKDQPPHFAWSSNLSMTCAEGICGSCLVNGFRGCKSHLAPLSNDILFEEDSK
jgi:NAD(P)H-flavin reductase